MMSTLLAIGGLVASLITAFVWAVMRGGKINQVQNDLDDASEYIDTRKAIDRAKIPIDTPVDDLRDELRKRPKDKP